MRALLHHRQANALVSTRRGKSGGYTGAAAEVSIRPLVSFARSSSNVHWDPAFHSLLKLAEACDISTRWSCRTGVCHHCETGLVAGTVADRPDPIDLPAKGNVLICCSKPLGDVVIDF